MSLITHKITALTSADRWFAVYEEKDGTRTADRLAVWAVMRESDPDDEIGDLDTVYGMVADLGGTADLIKAGEAINFVCYCHESDLERVLAERERK